MQRIQPLEVSRLGIGCVSSQVKSDEKTDNICATSLGGHSMGTCLSDPIFGFASDVGDAGQVPGSNYSMTSGASLAAEDEASAEDLINAITSAVSDFLSECDHHWGEEGRPAAQKRVQSPSSESSSNGGNSNKNSTASTAASTDASITVSTVASTKCQTAQLKATRLAHALKEQGVTTLMVRNIPSTVTQKCFLEELTKWGYNGSYDFVYLPCSFENKEGKGYSFINFISEDAVVHFTGSWHNKWVFGQGAEGHALNVSAATVQGLHENLKKWARCRRIRNPELRPFVVPVESQDKLWKPPSAPGLSHLSRASNSNPTDGGVSSNRVEGTRKSKIEAPTATMPFSTPLPAPMTMPAITPKPVPALIPLPVRLPPPPPPYAPVPCPPSAPPRLDALSLPKDATPSSGLGPWRAPPGLAAPISIDAPPGLASRGTLGVPASWPVFSSPDLLAVV